MGLKNPTFTNVSLRFYGGKGASWTKMVFASSKTHRRQIDPLITNGLANK